MAVDFPAPLGPKIVTISPLFTLIEQELIMSGPHNHLSFFPQKNKAC